MSLKPLKHDDIRVYFINKCNKCDIGVSTTETKAKTRVWLLDKNPPIFCESGAQGFKCAYPPTGEDVLLQVLAYKRYLANAKSGKEVRSGTATAMATDDLEKWWLKTGIPTKSAYGIEKMIQKIS